MAIEQDPVDIPGLAAVMAAAANRPNRKIKPLTLLCWDNNHPAANVYRVAGCGPVLVTAARALGGGPRRNRAREVAVVLDREGSNDNAVFVQCRCMQTGVTVGWIRQQLASAGGRVRLPRPERPRKPSGPMLPQWLWAYYQARSAALTGAWTDDQLGELVELHRRWPLIVLADDGHPVIIPDSHFR